MRVGHTKDLRRHERVEYAKPFRGVTVDSRFDGMIRDISPGGAALSIDLVDSQLSNYDFIELHIQSMDRTISSQVVRRYEGGVAVQFQVDSQEQKHIQGEIDRFKNIADKIADA